MKIREAFGDDVARCFVATEWKSRVVALQKIEAKLTALVGDGAAAVRSSAPPFRVPLAVCQCFVMPSACNRHSILSRILSRILSLSSLSLSSCTFA
eukprot:COSAG05_NODE_2326_length_3231_cov_38.996096_5_plen_96_part_00